MPPLALYPHGVYSLQQSSAAVAGCDLFAWTTCLVGLCKRVVGVAGGWRVLEMEGGGGDRAPQPPEALRPYCGHPLVPSSIAAVHVQWPPPSLT